jgi:xanthine dehydrogenase accessory factor
MAGVWESAVEQFEQGKDFVTATILSVRGSSPRHVGTRFLVKQDRSVVGTIGGGLFEANVLELAATVLENRASHRAFFSFQGKDARSTEMICGGEADVLVEFVDVSDTIREKMFRQVAEVVRRRDTAYLFTKLTVPMDSRVSEAVSHFLVDADGTTVGGFSGSENVLGGLPEPRLLKQAQILSVPGLDHPVFLEWIRPRGTVYIFGAGHVGICVAHLASYVDFRVVAIDDRADYADFGHVPAADTVVNLESFDKAFDGLSMDEDSYVVIVTRGHAHDRTVLAQALRTRAGYIGMIGSRRKINLIYRALLEEGVSREDLQKVHSPIGIPIGGETPQEIGMSIVAEMIQMRNRRDQIDLNGTRTQVG